MRKKDVIDVNTGIRNQVFSILFRVQKSKLIYIELQGKILEYNWKKNRVLDEYIDYSIELNTSNEKDYFATIILDNKRIDYLQVITMNYD